MRIVGRRRYTLARRKATLAQLRRRTRKERLTLVYLARSRAETPHLIERYGWIKPRRIA
jgi:hypothetical protein